MPYLILPLTAQIVKKDLQTVLSRVPDWVDPAAVATQIVRAFANNIWERYIADIINEIPNANLRTILSTLLKHNPNMIFKNSRRLLRPGSMTQWTGFRVGTSAIRNGLHLLLGIGFTFALNLDSVLIVRILSKDNSGLRESLLGSRPRSLLRHPAVPINAAGSAQPSPEPCPSSRPATCKCSGSWC